MSWFVMSGVDQWLTRVSRVPQFGLTFITKTHTQERFSYSVLVLGCVLGWIYS